jgi:hypothetical protein
MSISRALRNHKSPTPERTLAAFLGLALSNVLTYIWYDYSTIVVFTTQLTLS